MSTKTTAIEEAAAAVEAPVTRAGDAAIAALNEIAALNHKVQRAHDLYTTAQAEAKECREHWQALVEQLQTLIAIKTTPPSLPLFDAVEREADLARMTDGGNA